MATTDECKSYSLISIILEFLQLIHLAHVLLFSVSEAERALQNVPLFSSGSFDINTALNGFIDTMKSKIKEDPENPENSPIDTRIIEKLDAYVAVLLVEVFNSGFSEIIISI